MTLRIHCLTVVVKKATTLDSARLLKNWQDVLAKVRGALQRRGRTSHEAEDLVQEAWLRLARYEDEKQPVEQPEAFLGLLCAWLERST